MTTTSSVGECSYTHQFNDHTWECPHPPVDNGGLCVFHSDPEKTDGKTIRSAFLEAIHDHTRPAEFIGATLPELDLSHVLIDMPSRAPVDLRGATVHGDMNLDFLTVQQPFLLESACINGEFHAYHLDVDSDFEADGLECQQDVVLVDCTFAKKASFRGVVIDGQLDLTYSTFSGTTQFDNATISGETLCRQATFRRAVSFDQVTFGATVDLFGTEIYELKLAPEEIPAEGEISFEQCHIHEGEINSVDTPNEFLPVYDCTRATLGQLDIDIEPTELFNHFQFRRTEYDGFQFGQYREALKLSCYRIESLPHLDDQATTEEVQEIFGAIETTYINARRAAQRNGNGDIAGEFHIVQRMIERRRYRRQLLRGESLPERFESQTRLVLNVLEGSLSGYGERTNRVVFASSFTVLSFGMLYYVLSPKIETPIEGLLLSMEAAIAFLLGLPEMPDGTQSVIEILITMEALIGFVLLGVVFAGMVSDSVT